MAAALGFDHGKMRETDFVAMPRVGTEDKLARPLLATAGAEHVSLFGVANVHWPDNAFFTIDSGPRSLPADPAIQLDERNDGARHFGIE